MDITISELRELILDSVQLQARVEALSREVKDLKNEMHLKEMREDTVSGVAGWALARGVDVRVSAIEKVVYGTCPMIASGDGVRKTCTSFKGHAGKHRNSDGTLWEMP